jgi:dTDP-4-amino-4,6-dideoxygalactose transaminase
MREAINVTKTHLPDRERLDRYIDRIYESNWLTNNGQLVRELTARLSEYLGVENLLLVSNGTLALQIAYKALGVTKQAVTTPFTFVATASSLAWEGIEPVFADIDPKTFCIDPEEIEKRLTPETGAVVPVHVFGNACKIDSIEAIAKKRGIKTVYDAAHAFGVHYKGKSILGYGDASTLSFHATKIFHTIEGGAVVFKDLEVYQRARLMINFGIDGPDSVVALGINAKMNEFQAAMGLAVLDEFEQAQKDREAVWRRYGEHLEGRIQLQERNPESTNNCAYFPVVFDAEERLSKTIVELRKKDIRPRRYFYPSLDTLDFFKSGGMDNSRSLASRILCLPLSSSLQEADQLDIIGTLASIHNNWKQPGA